MGWEWQNIVVIVVIIGVECDIRRKSIVREGRGVVGHLRGNIIGGKRGFCCA